MAQNISTDVANVAALISVPGLPAAALSAVSGDNGFIAYPGETAGNVTISTGGSLTLNDGDTLISTGTGGGTPQELVIVDSGGTLNINGSVLLQKNNGPSSFTASTLVGDGLLNLADNSHLRITTAHGLGFGPLAAVNGGTTVEARPTVEVINNSTVAGTNGPRIRFDSQGAAVVTGTANGGNYQLIAGSAESLFGFEILFNGTFQPEQVPSETVLRNAVYTSHNGGNSLSQVYRLSGVDSSGNNFPGSGGTEGIDVGPQSTVGTSTDIEAPLFLIENAVGRGANEYIRFGRNVNVANYGGIATYHQQFRFTPVDVDGNATTQATQVNLPITDQATTRQYTDSDGIKTIPESTPRGGDQINLVAIPIAELAAEITTATDFTVPVRTFYRPRSVGGGGLAPQNNEYDNRLMVDSLGIVPLDNNTDTAVVDRYAYAHLRASVGVNEFAVQSVNRNVINVPAIPDALITDAVAADTSSVTSIVNANGKVAVSSSDDQTLGSYLRDIKNYRVQNALALTDAELNALTVTNGVADISGTNFRDFLVDCVPGVVGEPGIVNLDLTIQTAGSLSATTEYQTLRTPNTVDFNIIDLISGFLEVTGGTFVNLPTTVNDLVTIGGTGSINPGTYNVIFSSEVTVADGTYAFGNGAQFLQAPVASGSAVVYTGPADDQLFPGATVPPGFTRAAAPAEPRVARPLGSIDEITSRGGTFNYKVVGATNFTTVNITNTTTFADFLVTDNEDTDTYFYLYQPGIVLGTSRIGYFPTTGTFNPSTEPDELVPSNQIPSLLIQDAITDETANYATSYDSATDVITVDVQNFDSTNGPTAERAASLALSLIEDFSTINAIMEQEIIVSDTVRLIDFGTSSSVIYNVGTGDIINITTTSGLSQLLPLSNGYVTTTQTLSVPAVGDANVVQLTATEPQIREFASGADETTVRNIVETETSRIEEGIERSSRLIPYTFPDRS